MRTFNTLILFIYLLIGNASAYANLKVGTVFFYPPFVMSITTGFDVQFIQKICENLQIKYDLVPMNYNELYTSLATGKIDIAIGGITINSAGPENYIYSLPYILSKGAYLVLKSSNINSIDALSGAKVGIVRGMQDGDVFYTYLVAQNTQQFQIIQFDGMDDLVTALSNGEIAAAFTHESTVLYWGLNGGGQFKTVGDPVRVGEGIGIMSTPKQASLINLINKQIQNLEQSGFYMNLYTTYFANEE